MQNYCKTIGALAAASALVAGTAKAELEYSINGGYHNEYLFRGVQFGDSLVTSGFDIAGEAYGLDLSGGVWYASYDAPTGVGPMSTNETDVYAEVGKDLGFASLAIGWIKYINDDSNGPLGGVEDAQEVYFGLSKEICYGIDASLTYYWDIETDNDGYLELGLGKSYSLTECLSLGVGVALGYAVEEDDYANLLTTVTLDWAFAENATLSPYVLWVVDGESTSYETNSEQEFIGGVNLTVSF